MMARSLMSAFDEFLADARFLIGHIDGKIREIAAITEIRHGSGNADYFAPSRAHITMSALSSIICIRVRSETGRLWPSVVRWSTPINSSGERFFSTLYVITMKSLRARHQMLLRPEDYVFGGYKKKRAKTIVMAR
jgi:hypothetical protein